MLKRKPFLLAAILAVVMVMGVAGCTQADVQALQGTLKNVDSVSGNVTVTLKDGTTRTFNFTDVKVDTIKQALGNANLEIGDQVTVKVRKDGHVEEVDVKYAEVHGVIKGVGTDNVTITTKKQGDVTLKVTSETKIRIGDKGTANLTDLKIGQQAEVKYDVTTKNALRINADAGKDEEKRNEGETEGAVTATDNNTKTVTIKTEKGENITLNVTSNTTIRIEDHRTAAFSDIQVGQKIEAKYDKSNMNALRLVIEVKEDEHEDED
jgi:hypothetical protein